MVNNSIYHVYRSALNDKPSDYFKTEPVKVFDELLNGHIYIDQGMNLDKLSFRSSYGNRRNTLQQGEYSYRISLLIPTHIIQINSGIKVGEYSQFLKNNHTLMLLAGSQPERFKKVPLREISAFGQFQSISVPPELQTELAKYMVLYSGGADENLALEHIFTGEQAQRIIRQEENRLRGEKHYNDGEKNT